LRDLKGDLQIFIDSSCLSCEE